MADQDLSELTNFTGTPDDTDEFYMLDGGTLDRAIAFSELRDAVRKTGAELYLTDLVFVSWRLEIINNSGTLQHKVFVPSNVGDTVPVFNGGITSFSTSFTNTPLGADASTAMAAGGKVSSAVASEFHFDVLL